MPSFNLYLLLLFGHQGCNKTSASPERTKSKFLWVIGKMVIFTDICIPYTHRKQKEQMAPEIDRNFKLHFFYQDVCQFKHLIRKYELQFVNKQWSKLGKQTLIMGEYIFL